MSLPQSAIPFYMSASSFLYAQFTWEMRKTGIERELAFVVTGLFYYMQAAVGLSCQAQFKTIQKQSG
jgi:hypothetical protein